MDYYEQKELWDRELTNQEIERIDIIKKFILDDVESILDAGCGNGAIANSLVGFDVTAMDRSVEALKYVKNAKKIQGSLDNIPFKDNSFDLVICSDVLEHLPEDTYKKTIAELKRVSKKYILIISPNNEDLCANQSKCIKCGTVFHMNWHINSFCIDDIICDFRDDFAPVLYSFFGDKWASEPSIKYTLARTTGRGYKHWENAICPMCGSKQNSFLENTTDIDIECNKFLNGFYNNSTEFILLLSSVDHKKELVNVDNIPENAILSSLIIDKVWSINRQYIFCNNKLFYSNHLQQYPQYSYILSDDKDKKKRYVICFPFLFNSKKIYFNFLDNQIECIANINIYDLEKNYISIGQISFTKDGSPKNISFDIPKDVMVSNYGFLFEIIFPEEVLLPFNKIYIDNNIDMIQLTQHGLMSIFGINCSMYVNKSKNYFNSNFLLLERNTLIYNKDRRALFVNLHDTFEFYSDQNNILENNLTHKIEELKDQNNILENNLTHKIEELKDQNNIKKKIIGLVNYPKRKLNYFKLEYMQYKRTILKPLHTNIKYNAWSDGGKRFIMVCHDQNIDRRIIEEYKSLLMDGWEQGLIVAFSFDNSEYIEIKNGVIIHRASLGQIIPSDKIYWKYRKREFCLSKLKVMQKVLHRINYYLYLKQLKVYYNGKDIQDPLPFDLVFYNIAKRYKSDLVIAHDLPALSSCAKLAEEWNAKLVYDSHEMYSELNNLSKRQKKILSCVEQKEIVKCDAVFTVSDTIAEKISVKYGIKKPEVIYNAYSLPLQNLHATNQSLYDIANIPKDNKILLFQGGLTLDPNRNMLNLLLGFIKANIDRLHLVLMGPIDDKTKDKISQISKDFINKTIHILKPVEQEELLCFTKTATFGIIPYRPLYDGDISAVGCLPNKFFEFMQAELPILANSELLEVNKILSNIGGGFSCKMNTAEDIKDAIIKMMSMDLEIFRSKLMLYKKEISWESQEYRFLSKIREII